MAPPVDKQQLVSTLAEWRQHSRWARSRNSDIAYSRVMSVLKSRLPNENQIAEFRNEQNGVKAVIVIIEQRVFSVSDPGADRSTVAKIEEWIELSLPGRSPPRKRANSSSDEEELPGGLSVRDRNNVHRESPPELPPIPEEDEDETDDPQVAAATAALANTSLGPQGHT